MTSNSPAPKIEKVLYGALTLRFLTLLPKAFLPFTLPEVWRQSVTLGVTLRYWNRWAFESGSVGHFLPAVLDAFDGSGIMPMEAPILNVLFAPAFALGPYYGRIVALLGITILQFALLLVAHRVWRARFDWALLLLPFFSFTFGWFGKFTPDLVSVLLTLIGVGLLVERPFRRKLTLLASALIGLGLLMKPTSVAILVLLLLNYGNPSERLFAKIRRITRRYLLPAGVPTAVAIAYYEFVNPWIDRFRDTPAQFPVSIRSPLETAHGIATHPWAYLHVFNTRLFTPYLIYPVLILAFLGFAEARRDHGTGEFPRVKDWKLIGWCATLQILVLTFLSGVHVFDHEYYFMALAPIASLIFMRVLTTYWKTIDLVKSSVYSKFVPIVILALIVIPNLEAVWIEYRPLVRHSPGLSLASECADLIRAHPEVPFRHGLPFRSTPGPFPRLGLCFGEREMSTKAEWGFLATGEPDLSGCTTIDRRAEVRLIHCGTSN
jgi:hypothetical protein